MPPDGSLRIVYENNGEERQVALTGLVAALEDFLDHFVEKHSSYSDYSRVFSDNLVRGTLWHFKRKCSWIVCGSPRPHAGIIAGCGFPISMQAQ